MESDVLDLHRNFIENQKRQIELANQLIEHANGNEEVIRLAKELIRSCEKVIRIEQNINKTMTREEEIHIAASRYIEENSINGYVAISDHKDSFIEGAEWADTHPKSPWISVRDDLPCNHEELIRGTEVSEGAETVEVFARNELGDIWVDYMVYENGKWRWNDFEPAYWMIAPKLPKE